MIESGRDKIEDKIINSDLNEMDFHNKHFIRVGSKGHNFKKVDFSHTYFENCYFRDIIFDSCKFIGCKFINCNFQGSKFPDSDFDYATFEKTYIDSEILDNNSPSWNNLTLKFAKTLRMNYQGIGEYESVNKATKIELKATKEHLYESWRSKSIYYRTKYKGVKRIKMFFEWLMFKIEDFVWGNGENPIKLFRTGVILWCLMSIWDTIFNKDPDKISDYLLSFTQAPAIFMGIKRTAEYPDWYITTITIIRFIGFALFTSIIIKRFNRR